MTLNLAHLSAASPSQSILKTKDPLAPSWLQIHRYLLHLLTKSPNRKSMSSRGWVKAPHKGIPFPGLPGSQIGLTMRGCFLVCYKTDRRNRCRSVQEAAVLLGAKGASDECICCPWRPFPSEQVGSGVCIQACPKTEDGREVQTQNPVSPPSVGPTQGSMDPFQPHPALDTWTSPVCTGPVTDRQADKQKDLCLRSQPHR